MKPGDRVRIIKTGLVGRIQSVHNDLHPTVRYEVRVGHEVRVFGMADITKIEEKP